MKPSERIANAWFKHKGSDVSIPEMLLYINELAEFLAAAGVDKAFNVAEFHSHSDIEYGDDPCHCVACQAIRKLEAVG